MHNIRTCTTAYALILTIYCSIQLKICLVGPQNVLGPFIINEYSSQKIVYRTKTFSGSARFNCCTKLILYGYHFRLDLKIFRAIDQRKDKSLHTARLLDAEYWEPDSLSTTAKGTSTVSFEIRFLPLNRITPISQVFSNFESYFQSLPRYRTFSQTTQASIFTQCS